MRATVPAMPADEGAAPEAAWDELFDALPRGWMVGRAPRDPRSPSHRLYAFERRARRPDAPQLTVQATSEEEALRDLARQLRKATSSRRR